MRAQRAEQLLDLRVGDAEVLQEVRAQLGLTLYHALIGETPLSKVIFEGQPDVIPSSARLSDVELNLLAGR